MWMRSKGGTKGTGDILGGQGILPTEALRALSHPSDAQQEIRGATERSRCAALPVSQPTAAGTMEYPKCPACSLGTMKYPECPACPSEPCGKHSCPAQALRVPACTGPLRPQQAPTAPGWDGMGREGQEDWECVWGAGVGWSQAWLPGAGVVAEVVGGVGVRALEPRVWCL